MRPDIRDGATAPTPWVVPLVGPTSARAVVGGKAAGLGRLAAAGLPVPPGFVVTTAAYRAFVNENDLEAVVDPDRILGAEAAIAAVVDPAQTLGVDVAAEAEATAAGIQERFEAGTMPSTLHRDLEAAYEALGGGPVAVRSSAVFEDAADRSFAGLADTTLDVVGAADVAAAIVRCWSSLFSARAIAYLRQPGPRPDDLSMAVVVQTMVEADTSGVLFTADPLTGRHTEMLVEATTGIGESLVSGQVDPDRYRLDAAEGRVLEVSLGAKTETPANPGAPTDVQAPPELQAPPEPPTPTELQMPPELRAPPERALTDEQLRELAELGRRAARILRGPQDVEWAFRGGQLFVLQSRPITSLFPVPEEFGPDPLHVLVSYAASQGMNDAITPIGRDAIQLINIGAARAFGLGDADQDNLFRAAGGRLWIDITRLFTSRVGRRVARILIAALEPGARDSLRALEHDRRLAVSAGLPLASLVRVIPRAVPMLVGLVPALVEPEQQRAIVEQDVERELARAEARFEATTTLEERVTVTEEELIRVFEHLMGLFVPRYWAGVASHAVLHLLALGVPGGTELALTATRGLPHNITTAMGLELWDTAQMIAADPEAHRRFLDSPAQDLAERYLAGTLDEPAQSAIAAFLARFGMRGPGEVDMGRRRWHEEPLSVISALQQYGRIDDEELRPDVQFERSAEAAHDAIRQLAAALGTRRFGSWRAKLAVAAADRMRALTGLRELPKFLSANVRGFARRSLLESGRQLVATGVLEREDDVFFLHLDELRDLEGDLDRDWRTLVADRRAEHDREMRRRQVPRVLLSDGQVFYETADASGSEDGDGPGTLSGVAVSPGVVEGTVRVLNDPGEGAVSKDEIVVCRGADPGWTPLLLMAGGLVTETGGVMTHGSVVAREYGVPAVAGIARATERLQDGQRVRVDGTSGRVEILA